MNTHIEDRFFTIDGQACIRAIDADYMICAHCGATYKPWEIDDLYEYMGATQATPYCRECDESDAIYAVK